MSDQPPQASSRSRAWAFRIAGTVLFVALLVWLDLRDDLHLEDIFATLGQANVALVALSLALYVPFLVVKAARWRAVAADMDMPLTWPDSWRIYAIGLAAGTFTPGQAGDALKAWYLQRMGYPLGRALGSSLLDRLFDVAALALLGLLGVAVYGGRFAGQTPVLIAWAAGVAAVVAFFSYNRTRTWAVNLVTSFIDRRLSRFESQQTQGTERAQASWSFKPSTLVAASALTVASFATSIFRVWLLGAALGIWLGPLEVSGYVGLTTAAALVPVTVGGVGTRDAISALALSQLGYRPEQGVAVATLILLLNLAQALTGWVVWLRYRPSYARALGTDTVPAKAEQEPMAARSEK
jgi:glycosyltransferase 2 family protein